MIPASARVAVYDAPLAPFQLRHYPLRPPAPGEVLVRISMSTICRSDIHSWQGHRPNPCPAQGCQQGRWNAGDFHLDGLDRRQARVKDFGPHPLKFHSNRHLLTTAKQVGHLTFAKAAVAQPVPHRPGLGSRPTPHRIGGSTGRSAASHLA